jgi:hypothetical protein
VEPILALIPVPWLFILLSLIVFHKNLFLYCTMSFDCYEIKIYFVMGFSPIFYLLISLSVSLAANYLKLLHFRISYSVCRDNGAHSISHAPSVRAHRGTSLVFPDSVT